MGGFFEKLVSNPLGTVSDLLHDPLGAVNDLLDSVFGASERTVVNAAVSRVIQDSMLPNAIQTGTTAAIFESGDIPDYIMEGLASSIGLRAERMYAYAEKAYTHGLPSGQYKTAVDGKPEVTATLSAIEGAGVSVDYCHFRSPNILHIGWLKLVSDYGYDTVTNKLGTLSTNSGETVYLDNMTVMVPPGMMERVQAGALDQWGTAANSGYTPLRKYTGAMASLMVASPVQVDPLATSAYLRVEYIWEDLQKKTHTDSFAVAPTGFNDAGGYFHVKYKVNSVTKYWMYLAGSEDHPALDAVFASEAHTNGTFFPIAYFRNNGVAGTADKTTEAYKTTKKMLKYLGMDYDTVTAGIESNPDIRYLNQAMLIMAVPANTSNALERQYLFSFFDSLYSAGPNQFTSSTIADIVGMQTGAPDTSKSCLIIQDAQFKMSLSNNGIVKKRVGGVIGSTGSYTSGLIDITTEQPYVNADGIKEVRTIVNKGHYFRRQVSHALYDEITVTDLSMTYHLFGEYTSIGSGLDTTLLIPLDRSITKRYSVPERELLYSRSLHYVVNSRQLVTTHWYQTDLFKTAMVVVSIVVIALSWGSATGPVATLMSALAGVGTVTITAALLGMLQYLLVSLLIGYAFKLFVKAVGPEIAIALAIIAVVVVGYQVIDAGSVSGAPWAKELLQVSTGLSSGVQAHLGDMSKDLLEEYQTFNVFKDASTKALEAANKLLEHSNRLSPFVIFGEKPDDYYNRTVHAGNVGVIGIGAISSYVDTALTLPKLDESIEG